MTRGNKKNEIEIEEIFADHRNAPGFNKESMEGSLENPIPRKAFTALGGFVILIIVFFLLRIGFLQITKGRAFYERSEANYLKITPKETKRGNIFDRNGEILSASHNQGSGWQRIYPDSGFLHILGYLGNSGDTGSGLTGKSGLEFAYNDLLAGVSQKAAEEINAKGEVLSSGVLEKGQDGQNLLTSISKKLQIKLSEAIAGTMHERGFTGGAGIFIDVHTGELLAMASMPEFNPNILNEKNNSEKINLLINDPGHPFLNRAVSGLYPPGSIVKPAIAAGALAENIIDPAKQILSTGKLLLPNPYDPAHPNIFPDWKPLGWVDMRSALAMSSDIYFYEVGGGYGDQKGLGAFNIKKYLSLFGFGEKTGIDLSGEKSGHIPDPDEKQNGRDWSIGDTYHLAIGQGDLYVTPLQIAVYAATLATRGITPYPHVVTATADDNKNILEKFNYPPKNTSPLLDNAIFQVIHEGMRKSALEGTASGLGGLPIAVAAKTGTAEIGETGKVDSWSIGFFPYDSPRIAYAIMMEAGPRSNTIGATYVAAQTIKWMADTNFLSTLNSGILKQ